MKQLTIKIAFLILYLSLCSAFFYADLFEKTVLNSIALAAASFVLGLSFLTKFRYLPQVRSIRYVIPISFACNILSWIFILVFRFEYSVKLILTSGILLPLFFLVLEVLDREKNHRKFFCVPSVNIGSLKNTDHHQFVTLSAPSFNNFEINALVVDFKDKDISDEWERFLVNATFKKIPVYSYDQIKESLRGQVDLNFLEENDIGGLQPSAIVSFIKRILDVIFVLATLPITLPLCIVISLAIYLDSPGDIFFNQERIGLNGKPFNMIKFRSMSSEDNTSETLIDDQRVTKVGAILRRYRLDEIPQFINILIGDMSLIGPRPETRALVEYYDKEIPFFMYRHVVKPGISGWAQVMLGYTVGADEKREKLAYDLYYIKHYSIWLDMLIWFKTIKTVFIGNGVR